ncbi:MAG: VWA domain-containing protein [Bifidobacteriaceae bacterium]|jgi:hypothetical protein|nr:VWA domain-containing protein [Bifidobacteriaceae bacterium]
MIFVYPWLGVAVGAVLGLAALAAWSRARRRGRRQGGTRLANTGRVAGLRAFQTAIRQHRISAVFALVAAMIAASGAALMAARPAAAETVTPEVRTRDVVLCLDVSSSMYPVDAAILRQFREIVEGFDGERVAMSWFNSSSVTLFPLTDDYEFIDDTLAPLEEQFDAVAGLMSERDLWDLPLDMFPDQSGTLLGQGSSLPGDGLVSCLQLFDNTAQDRPRSVILATDNMVEGWPIFELGEAADLAKTADVRVYALCPDESMSASAMGAGPGYWSADAARELRREAESTGGAFYEAASRSSVTDIIEDILAEEAALTEVEPVRLIRDRPLWGAVTLAVGVAGLLIWGGWRGRPRWAAPLRRGALVVLATLAVVNPHIGTEEFKQTAVEADVVILVDTSPSVAAEDWDGDKPRLEGVKADIAAIAERHAGARFSIIAFDAEAHVTLPLTSDAGAVASAADTLAPISTVYASGSSIDAGLDALLETLEHSAEAHPERARLVYYLGDGEQTSSRRVKSFEEAAALVDGGAVFGYGTEAGGPMRERRTADNYSSSGFSDLFTPGDDPDQDAGYITAPDGSVGLSVVDEEALAAIAAELGVGLTMRSAESPVADALWSGQLPERVVDDSAAAPRPIGAWLAVAACPLIAWELMFLFRRRRVSADAARLARGAAATGWGTGGWGAVGPGAGAVPGSGTGADGIGAWGLGVAGGRPVGGGAGLRGGAAVPRVVAPSQGTGAWR